MLSLTATQLPRFMACNGSRLLGGSPPFNPDRSMADEGDAVHWLIEQVFEGHHTADELIDRKAPNGVFITGDMVENVGYYITDLMGAKATAECCDVEIKTSYAGENWEIRGRCDAVWFHQKASKLTVSDFKYGWKIVEPENNWTLISHAIGFLAFNPVNVSEIRLRIYQPRPYHPRGKVREWVISYDELVGYWQQLQAALSNPSDQLQTSQHCYKCPSMSQCPAKQIADMNAIDTANVAFNSEVDNSTLSWMLDNLSRAQEVLKQSQDAYEDLALHRLRAGQAIEGYTAQTSKGKTQWNDGMTAEVVQMLTGVDVSKPGLITPNQAKNAGISPEVLATMTNRPDTGVKLVRQDVSKKAEKLLGKR